MIVELERGDYDRARSVFLELDFHLAISAVLGGSVPGKVFVDDASSPRSALVWTNGRLHLAGSAENEGFNLAVGRLFAETIFPQAKAAGRSALGLFYDWEGWEPAITNRILKDQHPERMQREYYTFQQLRHDWRAMLPTGYRVQFVDAQLLANRQLQNLERLEAELCSERESVAAFLSNSFGVCLVQEDAIAAWCLSEYNQDGRCEIGIETVEAYQRRGFATLTASALVEQANVRGIRQIGWDCYAGNIASGAAARAIGFQKERDYPAYIAWIG
jgi:RimJ/RimL family protein N-acetyltransferase